MILLIDNYDSFTFNIYQYLKMLKAKVNVIRNDAMDAAAITQLRPQKIVISPGPGEPYAAGHIVEVIKHCSQSIPILGICLGHQAIAAAFGGHVIRAPQMMHGKTSEIFHKSTALFRHIPSPLQVARYHSLIVEKSSLPKSLKVTAETADGIIMSLKHKSLPVYGVQFHPESYASDHGHTLLRNFLEL